MALIDFYNDQQTRAEVREYLAQFVREDAVRMMLNGEDVSHVKLANDFIIGAWDRLDTLFAKKPAKNTENEAR